MSHRIERISISVSAHLAANRTGSAQLPTVRSGFFTLTLSAFLLTLSSPLVLGEVSLPSIFGDHMVLQRDQQTPVWGKADAGEAINVSIDGQSHEVTADGEGNWRIELDPMEAGGPHTMTVTGTNSVTFDDVLIGDVWFCSGQSNMGWVVASSNDAPLEIASANYPEIRLMTVPRVGSAEPQDDFEGEWVLCSPETVRGFSAIGYFFGRRLHQVSLSRMSRASSTLSTWRR